MKKICIWEKDVVPFCWTKKLSLNCFRILCIFKDLFFSPKFKQIKFLVSWSVSVFLLSFCFLSVFVLFSFSTFLSFLTCVQILVLLKGVFIYIFILSVSVSVSRGLCLTLSPSLTLLCLWFFYVPLSARLA